MSKVEMNDEDFSKKTFDILELSKNSSDFFFYFSPDPDAIGVSIAFALFLNKLGKRNFMYLPDGFDYNLNFLLKIAEYNDIGVYRNLDDVIKHLKKVEAVFVTCDTPTFRLLPEYEKIIKIRDGYKVKKAIEIDHHFGGDSEQIYPESETIFFQANSCCDILANFFQIIAENDRENTIDYYFPRNVVLSLLVGMCYDTQFGKFLVNETNYNKWFGFLSEKLNALTWGNSPHIKSASEVFHTINKMSEIKMITISNLVDSAEYKNGVGLLVLPIVGKYESLAENGDSTCILTKISSDIANMLPESAGKVGIFCYYDDVKDHYLVKMRRSALYKGYDLRDFEGSLRDYFGEDYIGGGGHPGATSFRIKFMERDKFLNIIKEFLYEISERL